MTANQLVPDFLKLWMKRIAFRLYRLSKKFFTGPFDRYDFQAIEVFRRCLKPGDNCIDVGAHAGHILREIIRSAPQGRHLAIEPLPNFFRLLQRKYGRKVSLFNGALSDEAGRTTFTWYPDRPALSGFRAREFASAYPATTLDVEMKKLDDLLPPHETIRLIKIDVEGAELQVLQGAEQTLTRCQPIVLFETGIGGADAYGTRPEDLYDLFERCGLSLTLMEYFLEGKAPMSREEFIGQFNKSYNFFFMAYREEKENHS